MSKVTETAPPNHCPSEHFFNVLALRQDPHALAGLLHNQLDVNFYDDLALFMGLSTKKLFSLLGFPTAVQRRWKKVQQLTISESDYAFRQALVIHDALGLFEGNTVETRDWLTKPNIALGRVTPVSLLSTFVGMSIVESLIWKIENGVYQ